MLELLPSGTAHVVAMRVGGRVDANDLQRAIDAIESAKKTNPRISLYAEIDEIRWMTFTAFLRDLGYGLTQIGDMGRYYRAAAVSDKHWVRHLVRLENHVFRSTEMRTFRVRDKRAALEWASQSPPDRDGHEGAMA